MQMDTWVKYLIIGVIILFLLPFAAARIAGTACDVTGDTGCEAAQRMNRGSSVSQPIVTREVAPAYYQGSVAPPVYAPAAPPAYRGQQQVRQVQPIRRKTMIDSPAQRGSANEYCFQQHPHWRRVMATRDDCQITTGHGSGSTLCKIRCG